MWGLRFWPTLAVGVFLICSSVCAQGDSPHLQLAEEFLDALVFHDQQGIWSRLDSATQSSTTPESLIASIEAMPIVAGEAEVVSIQPSETGASVRYRLSGVHPNSGTPVTLPGTFQIVSDGDRLAVQFRPPGAARASAPPQVMAPSAPQRSPMLPQSQVIDGLSANDILDRMTAAHGNIQSMRMGVQINANMMGQVTNLGGEFLYMAPNRIRLDLGEILFVSNGMSANLYLAAANAHMTLPGNLMSGLSGLTPGFGGGTSSTMQASLIGAEDINGVRTYHLALIDQRASGAASSLLGGMSGPIHVWVDTERYFPVRTRASAMGMQMEMDFHSMVPNPGDIAPEVFNFRPPPGSMEIPMMLPL